MRGSSANWSQDVCFEMEVPPQEIELSDDGLDVFESDSSSSDSSFSLSTD